MATSTVLPAGLSLPLTLPRSAPVQRPANGELPALFQEALANPEVRGPATPPKVDPSRRPPSMVQVRPEYALVTLMAQRPGQLRKLYETLGGSANNVDADAMAGELQAHLAAGGTLAEFGASKQIDPAILYLLAVQCRTTHRGVRDKSMHRLEREMDALVDAFDTEICAALNTSQAMRQLNASSDRLWMRSLYVAAITVRSPISEVFESLLQRFGPDGFERGAATLLRALSDDMASQRSSIPSDRLQGLLLASLVSMRHVLGLMNSGKGFLRREGFMVDARKEQAAPSASGVSGRNPEGGEERGEQGGESSPQERAGRQGVESVLNERRRQADVMTVQLVKLLLQLTLNSAAVRGVPSFLVACTGGDDAPDRAARLRLHFIELVQNLPATLWKETSHKDQLVEALRRHFDVDMVKGGAPQGPAVGAGQGGAAGAPLQPRGA